MFNVCQSKLDWIHLRRCKWPPIPHERSKVLPQSPDMLNSEWNSQGICRGIGPEPVRGIEHGKKASVGGLIFWPSHSIIQRLFTWCRFETRLPHATLFVLADFVPFAGINLLHATRFDTFSQQLRLMWRLLFFMLKYSSRLSSSASCKAPNALTPNQMLCATMHCIWQMVEFAHEFPCYFRKLFKSHYTSKFHYTIERASLPPTPYSWICV